MFDSDYFGGDYFGSDYWDEGKGITPPPAGSGGSIFYSEIFGEY